MIVDQKAIIDSFLLLVILSLVIERSLALVFEHQRVSEILQGKGLKEFIAFCVCFAVCSTWKIDIFSSILSHSEPKTFGIVLTAMGVSGGSKASIKLFQDVIGAGRVQKSA